MMYIVFTCLKASSCSFCKGLSFEVRMCGCVYVAVEQNDVFRLWVKMEDTFVKCVLAFEKNCKTCSVNVYK